VHAAQKASSNLTRNRIVRYPAILLPGIALNELILKLAGELNKDLADREALVGMSG
jgi:hypothetical protein